ncbi:transcription factor Spi-C [Zootoca vivipara]|uniref:transcription factor Spi-C n=1 Tax=Zootoca vivipara TaxID=8524 RepID=UPI0015901F00|nr:transcription factor Spi-C [Zootoca vivipara]
MMKGMKLFFLTTSSLKKLEDLIFAFLKTEMSFTDQDLLGQAFEDALEVLQQHSYGDCNYAPEDFKNCLTYHHHSLQANPSYLSDKPIYSWSETPTLLNTEADFYLGAAEYHTLQTVPENPEMCAIPLQQKGRKGRKKLRLFEYIHESLHNPDLANCIQWLDKPNGVFQFVSKHKEKLAELWGERKGNRKIMTYQKMARALRNYGRTGEIIKIRRKLTYQFGAMALQRLSLAYFHGKEGDFDLCHQGDQKCQYADSWLSYHYYM